MYRQYEDPRALEKQREELMRTLATQELDVDTVMELNEELLDLNERINFAWQDEEFEEIQRRAEREYEERARVAEEAYMARSVGFYDED